MLGHVSVERKVSLEREVSVQKEKRLETKIQCVQTFKLECKQEAIKNWAEPPAASIY